MRRRCVYLPGSNVVRDQVLLSDDPHERVLEVDSGEWLLRRSLFLEMSLSESYDYEDWKTIRPDDAKMLLDFVDAGIPIASTHMPTLEYVMGGHSNGQRDERFTGVW
jgi:hypothetical protein